MTILITTSLPFNSYEIVGGEVVIEHGQNTIDDMQLDALMQNNVFRLQHKNGFIKISSAPELVKIEEDEPVKKSTAKK